MTIQLKLALEVKKALKKKAGDLGLTLEAYLEALAEREVSGEILTLPEIAEFEKGLEKLSEGLPALNPLPSDFSRADIYIDHA